MTAARPIGLYVSPDTKITFLEEVPESGPTLIRAKLPNIDNLVPVRLPEIQNKDSLSGFTTVAKVRQLLRNCHLQPIYQTQQNEVCFDPIPPAAKTWEKQRELSLPNDEVELFYRADGTISYAFINTVTTLDWVNDKCSCIAYKTSRITALTETAAGILIVGDQEGQLLVSDEVISTGFKKPIEKIIQVRVGHCLIKFADNSVIVFDLESKQVIIELGSQEEVFVLGVHRIIVALNKNEMTIHKYDENDKKYRIIEHNHKEIDHIKALSNTKILILHKDEKHLTLWDVESDSVKMFENQFLWENGFKKIILLDNETLAIPDRSSGKPHISFYSKGAFQDAAPAGRWLIIDMILLSDGSIMYGTDTRPSGIHVVTNTGAVTFSKYDELTDNQPIKSLTELVDGSVAVKFNNSVLILKPKITQHQVISDQIDNLKSELRRDPSRLDLYRKLAALHKKDSEEEYQTYLSGLCASIKFTNLYHARRFFEKARKLRPDQQEPFLLFLNYLHKTPYQKLFRQVRSELFILTKDESIFSSFPREKKCKKRLLIGEGDFTFTEALINKHQLTRPKLPESITATELLAPADETVTNRVAALIKRGVTVLFGIDGQLIHQIFKGKRFERIHWNCPFGGAASSSRSAFPTVIPNFFQSSSQIQLVGDRIHVTLVQKGNTNINDQFWKTRQIQNPIVLGATAAGYRLIRKRTFGAERYPGYRHVKTGTIEEYSAGGKEQEFVFEKTNKPRGNSYEIALALLHPRKKDYAIKTDGKEAKLNDYYFECSTDEDSSDYYESE